MSKKSRISFEIKIKYVQNYLAGKISISDVCKELNITRWAFYLWITKYDSSGAEVFVKLLKIQNILRKLRILQSKTIF